MFPVFFFQTNNWRAVYHKVGDARFALWYDDLGMWRLGDRADVGSTGKHSLLWKYRALLWIDRALLRECRALFKCFAVVRRSWDVAGR